MVWTALFDSLTLMYLGDGEGIEEPRLKHTHGLDKA